MMWEAIGGLVLVAAALTGLIVYYGHLRWEAGYEAHKNELADRRAERRAEQRARAARDGHHLHQLAPFPDRDWAESLATTGELRALSETGDMDTIRGHVAAFFRTLSLQEWTRKKETAA